MKHLENLQSLTTGDLREILRVSSVLKQKTRQGERPSLLSNYCLAQLFEKPSLRTRLSFDVAMTQLGGTSLFFSAADVGLNGRESLADVARVITRYADILVIRAFSQNLITEFARHASCPVINGLSDVSHPCQAIADLMTIQEHFGSVKGKTIVFVGDGNNVARSLATAAAKLGVKYILSAPEGYEFGEDYHKLIRKNFPEIDLEFIRDPKEAVKKADVIYTDVWASMGQEAEAAQRQKDFAGHQVNGALMKLAPAHAKFMHCLPARRGMEVTDDVMDGKWSLAFEQAENRMHSAKGIILWLLNKSYDVK